MGKSNLAIGLKPKPTYGETNIASVVLELVYNAKIVINKKDVD